MGFKPIHKLPGTEILQKCTVNKTIVVITQVVTAQKTYNEVALPQLVDQDLCCLARLVKLPLLKEVGNNLKEFFPADSISLNTLFFRLHLVGNLPEHSLFITMLEQLTRAGWIFFYLPVIEQHL